MTCTIEDAMILAAMAHRGQVDQAGVPYVNHLMRVAAYTEPGYRVAALLHDILEDTDETDGTLEAWGVNFDDRATIRQVTRLNKQHVTYTTYIQGIIDRGSVGALRVKLADLRDHLENPNPIVDPKKRYSLTSRYLDARRRLMNELELRGLSAWSL